VTGRTEGITMNAATTAGKMWTGDGYTEIVLDTGTAEMVEAFVEAQATLRAVLDVGDHEAIQSANEVVNRRGRDVASRLSGALTA
jgi:hypothetical protein